MDVAIGKLKMPEGMDAIWLENKVMEVDVTEVKLKAPDGMDVIWLEDKVM